MRGILTIIAVMLAITAAPASADSRAAMIKDPVALPEESLVLLAVDAFFAALRSDDKTALAQTMLPQSVIFIHDRRDPENPTFTTRKASVHLKGWEDSPQGTDEYMTYENVLIDGTMAHVWGPYTFLLNGAPTHCGINSMSLAKTPKGWRIANTSFTMTTLDECEPLGAPKPPAKDPE